MTDNTVTYSPAEAGAMVGQTENWMKTKARNRQIPHTRPGRAIRFTPSDVAEIIRMNHQPAQTPANLVPSAPARTKAAAPPGSQVTQLQSRPPKRLRETA